ncbi:hypothetical protein C2E20_4619 [Micractinium conductrix]|uniref:SAM domain-containing protein n=1 Tax=Micractinium conductrix TaxID=554055 RepID=A0A2P6VDE2_9CHLO|nr:hypothetical protein C2E20_4619 [Micractinium conductrix]|eukprot:PSC72099.1 hypothetical protein C2E20_4619 [Micractinium conductrix]
MASSAPHAWSVQQVSDWLTSSLELPATVATEFQANAIGGPELVTLSDEDLTNELGLTSLQARKVRRALVELGVAAPAAPAAATPAVAPAMAPAAPPPAAAPAVAPPPKQAAPSFAPADLERYSSLKAQIASLQALQVGSKVAQAKQHAGAQQARLAAAHQALPGAQEAVAEAQKANVKMEEDKWYPGKALGGKSKQQEKLEHTRAALAAAQKRLADVQAAISDGQAQFGEAQKQLSAWQGKAAELETAQRTLEQLVDRMFASPAWQAAPRVAEIGDALRGLETQAAEARRGVTSYGRGAQLLTGAAKQLEGALQSLRTTQVMNMVGMGRGMAFAARTGMPGRMQPGGLMGDMVELAIFRRANEAVSSAARDTAEARALLGSALPQVDEEILKSARAGLFINMLTGGAMMDVMQAAMVRRSVAQVEKLLSQVLPAAQWAQSNLSAYQGRDASLRGQMDAKRGELGAYRSQQLAAALAPAPTGAAAVAAKVEQLSLI